LAERAKGEDSIAPLAKLPHVMFFGGGVVIKLGESARQAHPGPSSTTAAHTRGSTRSTIG
jgi:hypothetical protein